MNRYFIFILLGLLSSAPSWADWDPEEDARERAEFEAQQRAEQERMKEAQKQRSDTEAKVNAEMQRIMKESESPRHQMSDEQMQQMMEGAGAMQECMAKIDQKAMDAMAAKGEKASDEIKALCTAGKRDEAQKRAIDYGKEMAADPQMREMQKCGAMGQGMMPQYTAGTGDGKKPRHVCDEM